MIKWYHILITLALGVAIGYFLPHDAGSIEIVDPQIQRLKQEIGWRDFKEAKIKDSLKFERKEKMTLAKENIELRAKSDKAFHHFAEVRRMIPKTRKDTIVFLQIDTAACDSALLRARELAAGLTIEIITDNAIIKNLDSLNSDLNADKKDLVKVDSLNQIEKKQLRKEARRKARRAFFKGTGIGGALVAILVAIF